MIVDSVNVVIGGAGAGAGVSERIHVILVGGVGGRRRRGHAGRRGKSFYSGHAFIADGVDYGGIVGLGGDAGIHVGFGDEISGDRGRNQDGADGGDSRRRSRGHRPIFGAGSSVAELIDDFVVRAGGIGAGVGYQRHRHRAGRADGKLHGTAGDGLIIGSNKGGPRYFQVAGGWGAVSAVNNVAHRGGGRTGGVGQAGGENQRDEA